MIITLLTDFGGRDSFVAQMKGVILGIQPRATIVDITHEIPAFGIRNAAYTLRTAYRSFPRGTIHVAVIDPGVGGRRRALLVENRQGRFLGPDNGILSYIYRDHASSRIYELASGKYRLKSYSSTFDGRDLFAPVAAWLARGISPGKLGKKITDPVTFLVPEIERRKDGSLAGEVVHTDRFGNLITNIEREDLLPWLSDGKKPVITIKRRSIEGLRMYYAEPAHEELAAIINSDDQLEIYGYQKNASSILNVISGERVIVE